ncbi:hypothetical protein SFA35_16900 [Pseudomonas sp. HR96]|uniref:hypothetical protein n=1 Tax=Pseudomonas sp. HR96 TaxID=1027966 RepID=UPI002A74781E|nr:hypothetical protein [Pseudomonas sp. HR96]WPO98316.1 hypothetical protein SFA35_16900 [Pseudomonas sp. HR96]
MLLRLVLMLLSQAFKRVSAGIASIRRDSAVLTQNDNAVDDTDGFSKSAVMIIAALALYIAGGLGYYAKVHIWDGLTPQQKDFVVHSMMVDQQVL